MTTSSGLTASSLCAPLIDGAEQVLTPVHRSPLAWQLADATGRVVLCITKPSAIRLPHGVVVPSLPSGSSPISVGGGTLGWDGLSTRNSPVAGTRHRVSRWWQPARPFEPRLRRHIDDAAALEFAIHWKADLGRGEGLTPFADDIICGALVLLRATAHPMSEVIATDMSNVDLENRTTATSSALLRYAAQGWCIDPLADYLAQLATGGDPSVARQSLRAVGHTSGTGLHQGVHLLLRDASKGVAA